LLPACGMCSPNASTSPAATRRHWSSRSVSLPRLVFPRRCIRARAAALGCRIRNIGWSHSARRCVRRGHARRVTGGQLCGSIARAGPPSPRGRTIVSWSLCDAHRACIRVGPTTAYRRSRRRVGAARPALTMMAPSVRQRSRTHPLCGKPAYLVRSSAVVARGGLYAFVGADFPEWSSARRPLSRRVSGCADSCQQRLNSGSGSICVIVALWGWAPVCARR
jgi:hypothetical protein